MRCGKCGTGFDKCTCPNADERLKSLAFDPKGFVAFKWCRTCDKHYARCKCETPAFYLVHRGEEMKQEIFQTLEGGKLIPNMRER